MDMATHRLNVIVERDEGGYVARCVDPQGCLAQGETAASTVRLTTIEIAG